MHPHYLAGSYDALERLGLLKTAGDGNVQQQLTPATGDPGRSRARVHDAPDDTARSAFMNHEQQMRYPADESYQFSVGSGQSKAAAQSSGYPLQGRMTFQGLQISIEQKKGAVRKWKDESTGEEGSTKMLHPYGYIRMTEGADGDHVDVYVGPYEEATHAYIVNQMKKPKQNADKRKTWSEFDEQKVMLGFRNATEAKNAYIAQYNDPRFFGSMVVMPMPEFKKKVLDKKNWGRKLASNLNEIDRLMPVRSEMGSVEGQVPGDHLGVLGKLRDGNDTQPGGWEADSDDLIDHSFRFMDQQDGVRVLDGDASATPASPAV